MQAQADEADGCILVLTIEVRVFHVSGIDDGHAAAADHFQPIVGVDESAGILIEPDAYCRWIDGHRRQQTPEALSLTETTDDSWWWCYPSEATEIPEPLRLI